MALETLKDVMKINGVDLVDINKEKEEFEKSSPVGQRQDGITFVRENWNDYFERVIRKNKFIYVRHDVNSLSFTLQNGPIKEVGVNGCQVSDVIAVAKHIIEELNKKFPCRENSMTITKLDEALMWQDKRTKDRELRNVEGLSIA